MDMIVVGGVGLPPAALARARVRAIKMLGASVGRPDPGTMITSRGWGQPTGLPDTDIPVGGRNGRLMRTGFGSPCQTEVRSERAMRRSHDAYPGVAPSVAGVTATITAGDVGVAVPRCRQIAVGRLRARSSTAPGKGARFVGTPSTDCSDGGV